jgi:hemerythrin-like metal-binding protein
MSFIEWSEGMSVGVPALDSDHKCLIRIIDLLSDIEDRIEAPRMIGTVLETLVLYGRHHFTREERVMAAVGFPGAAFHHGEHQGFTKYIRSLKQRCSGKGDPETAGELLEYLSAWLRHHILIQDMAIKPYIAEIEQAETAAQSAGPSLLELQ